jgi:hypothetical protein
MEIADPKAYKEKRIAAAFSRGTPSKTLGSGPEKI